MTKVKIGYKVVHVDNNGNYRPWITHDPKETNNLMYRGGHWVKRRKGMGPYCVFTTIEHFQYLSIGEAKVFKCEYTESKDKTVWNFMSEYDRIPSTMPLFNWRHSALADSVKLIEEVKV